MDALIPDPAQLALMPEGVKALEAAGAEPDLTSSLAAMEVRATTLTRVMEEILQFRPSSRWGINE